MENSAQNRGDWEQPFLLYRKALAKLTIAVEILQPNEEENLELEVIDVLLKDGLIRRFEYAFEAAWMLMQKYEYSQSNNTVKGPESAILAGLKSGLITNADGWMAMLKSRKDSSLKYEEESTHAFFQKIMESYYLLFLNFEEKMVEIL